MCGSFRFRLDEAAVRAGSVTSGRRFLAIPRHICRLSGAAAGLAIGSFVVRGLVEVEAYDTD